MGEAAAELVGRRVWGKVEGQEVGCQGRMGEAAAELAGRRVWGKVEGQEEGC